MYSSKCLPFCPHRNAFHVKRRIINSTGSLWWKGDRVVSGDGFRYEYYREWFYRRKSHYREYGISWESLPVRIIPWDGATKVPFVNFSAKESFDFARVAVRFFESCSYLIGVACYLLTHWGRVTHRCVSKINIIGSDNGQTLWPQNSTSVAETEKGGQNSTMTPPPQR